MAKTLKVRAVEGAMVPDFQAMDEGIRRYIGRRHQPYVPGTNEIKVPEDTRTLASNIPLHMLSLLHGDAGEWVATGETVEVPFRKEYLDEIKAGCLVPADEETARMCGVPVKAD